VYQQSTASKTLSLYKGGNGTRNGSRRTVHRHPQGNGSSTTLAGTHTQTGATACYINGNGGSNTFSPQTQTGVSKGGFSAETYTSIPGNPGGQLGMGQGAPSPLTGGSASSGNSSAPTAPVPVCFAAGTLVLLADGSCKPIEQIQPNEKVLAAAESDPEGPLHACRVVETYHNEPKRLLAVRLAGASEPIRCTFKHPFYVRSKGWTAAEELVSGDELRTPEGSWAKAEGVADAGQVEPVYNIQVENDHTYFVSVADGAAVLVHNDTMCAPPKPTLSNYFYGFVGIINNGTANAVDGLVDGATGLAWNLTHSSVNDPTRTGNPSDWALSPLHRFGSWWGSTDLSAANGAYGPDATQVGVKVATVVNGTILFSAAKAPFKSKPTPTLPSDVQSALGEIKRGVPRPNVRNPKPFANDGRGGTARLPWTDANGNPITYAEHTVNARPPGGTLDAKRIIVGSDGSIWYTLDHFKTLLSVQ
jgi:hypothetical protein